MAVDTAGTTTAGPSHIGAHASTHPGTATAAPERHRMRPHYRPWPSPPPSHRALAMSIRGTWPSAERAASRSGVPSSR